MRRYELHKHLGAGGMAQVYLGIQRGSDGFAKLVAIKRMSQTLAQDPAFVGLFLREARLACRIRHQNVVAVHDVRVDDGLYLVMDYLQGETLATVLDHGPIPYPIACRVIADAAAGLAAAHEADVLHRDVSPSNVMLCDNGHAKLLDFGVAAALQEARRDPTFCGKRAYAAPEQLRGEPTAEHTDVYQLGVVLYELLTGERLFAARTTSATTMAALNRPIPRPSSRVPSIPTYLDDVVLEALERSRARRPPSASALQVRLEGVLRRASMIPSHWDVAAWMKGPFAEGIEQRAVEARLALSAARRLPGPRSDVPRRETASAPRKRRRAAMHAASATGGLLMLAGGLGALRLDAPPTAAATPPASTRILPVAPREPRVSYAPTRAPVRAPVPDRFAAGTTPPPALDESAPPAPPAPDDLRDPWEDEDTIPRFAPGAKASI